MEYDTLRLMAVLSCSEILIEVPNTYSLTDRVPTTHGQFTPALLDQPRVYLETSSTETTRIPQEVIEHRHGRGYFTSKGHPQPMMEHGETFHIGDGSIPMASSTQRLRMLHTATSVRDAKPERRIDNSNFHRNTRVSYVNDTVAIQDGK